MGSDYPVFFDSNDGGRDGAFHGEWEDQDSETFSGSFTVQCKFTSKADKTIKSSDLTDELKKAKRLAAKGLCDNYFLLTNANLTGANTEDIEDTFEKIPQIKKCKVFGKERISQIIQESSRLRMLVPRVYGLGDLSQILDERAYAQAQDILSSLGDDFAKFIITDAFRQSAKALTEHGFVLLLGAPMCGKSTIAAALAMGALDQWGCSTIKVRDADDFVKHSNPNEKQLFWVDDAFGSTQLDWSSANNWNRTIPHVNAAIKRGSKIIFTSRDYIYRSAKRILKESAIPIMKESQVVINVEKLPIQEREQILYNHIKLGKQKTAFKKKIKPFLQDVASYIKFSPEIARRLGDPFFTKELTISQLSLKNFVENPLEMLGEIISTIDDSSQAALALVFINGGELPTPFNTSKDEKLAIARIGSTVGGVRKGLEDLNGSLLINSTKNGKHCWQFKHPTVRDAYAKAVSYSPDLMDIYLTGAPLETLLHEVSCGDLGIEGISVIVPESQYDLILERLHTFEISNFSKERILNSFLSHRCDKSFLTRYIEEFPNTVYNPSISSPVYIGYDIDLLVKLHEFSLLPETTRLERINTIKDLAVLTPDSSFLREGVKSLFTDEEFAETLLHVEDVLLPNLDDVIYDWKSEYRSDEDPESYFDELNSTLYDFKEEFESVPEHLTAIESALDQLVEIIEELNNDYIPSDDFWITNKPDASNVSSGRSIFDDVDQ